MAAGLRGSPMTKEDRARYRGSASAAVLGASPVLGPVPRHAAIRRPGRGGEASISSAGPVRPATAVTKLQ